MRIGMIRRERSPQPAIGRCTRVFQRFGAQRCQEDRYVDRGLIDPQCFAFSPGARQEMVFAFIGKFFTVERKAHDLDGLLQTRQWPLVGDTV